MSPFIPQIAGSYRGSYFSIADPRNHRRVTSCLPSLSPFVIRLLGFSWLQLLPCQATLLLDFLFELLLATAALYPKLVFFLAELSTTATLFPEFVFLFPFGGCWQLSPCFPVHSSFSRFMILYLWFLYLFICSYVMLALYACYWFMSSSMVSFYSPFFAICVG